MFEKVVGGDFMYYTILEHHGAKGQRWGIRRYQRLDGSLTPEGRAKYSKILNKMSKKGIDRTDLTMERIIPKGTKMYRTSTNPNENLIGSTYVSYLDVDRNHYKNGWVRKTGNADHAYEYQFDLKDDLKIPSRAYQQDVINQVLKKNKKYINECVKSWVDEVYPPNTWMRYSLAEASGGDKKLITDMINNFKNKTPEEAGIMVCQSLGKATNLKKEIITRLKKDGYNAMSDEAGIGGRNGWSKEGYDPLIIFDASILNTVRKHQISRSEENKASIANTKWTRKINSNSYAKWSGIFASTSYLAHHGVKGMKWGVRRYQNPDGSLTNKGKKRLAKLVQKDDRIVEKDNTLRDKLTTSGLKSVSKEAAELRKVSDAFYNLDDKTYSKYLNKAAKAFANSPFAKNEGISLQDAMELYNKYDGDQGYYNSFRYYLNDKYKGGAKAYDNKAVELNKKFRDEASKSVDDLLKEYGDMPIKKNSNSKVRDALIDALGPALDFDIVYVDD